MIIIIQIHNVIVTQFSSWLSSTRKSSDNSRRATERCQCGKTNAWQIQSERKSGFKTFKLKLILTTVYCAVNLSPFSRHFIAVIRRWLCTTSGANFVVIFYLQIHNISFFCICPIFSWLAHGWEIVCFHLKTENEFLNLFGVMNVVESIW